MIFDPRDRQLVTGTSQRPPVLPDLPPTDAIGEIVMRFGASLDLMRAQDQTVARRRMTGEALQPYLDAYEAETGEALDNPYDGFDNPFSIDPERGLVIGDEHARTAALREKYEAARSRPGDRMVSRLPAFPSGVELLERAKQRARTVEERTALAESLPGSAAGDVAGFAGSMAGALEDPPNLISLFAGAPRSAGILGTMAAEALIGAGVELNLQPQVAAWKRELGREPTFAEMAANVALAGAGAGAFAGLIKGGGKAGAAGWRKVKPLLSREQREAVHVADALDTVERRNPFEVARQARQRGERTGGAPSARFGEELRAGDGGEHVVDLEVLPGPARSEISLQPTVERTAAGDQVVLPGAERIPERQALERRMAARDVRGGQDGLEGLGLFDPASRARQADLLDAPTQRAAERAVHIRATQEAEASLANGQAPDGPAIRAIDQAVPDLELPVWEARTGKGKSLRWRGPMDIVTWARTIGGLKDDAGELKARDLQKLKRTGMDLAKGENFLGRLVNDKTGVDLDTAARAAWEAGYFPGATSRPTPDDLLAAIDRTVAAGADVDRRVWSEHDSDLVERLRGRIDPDAEEHARELLGDEMIDAAIAAIDGMPVIDEPLDPELQRLLDSGERAVVGLDDAERITLEALRDELEAGDFRVTEDAIDEAGNVTSTSRSAREAWADTQAETAGWRDAAACMTGSAA